MKNTFCKSLIFLLLAIVILLSGCDLYHTENFKKQEEIPEENLIIYTDSFTNCTTYQYSNKIAIKTYQDESDELLLRDELDTDYKNIYWKMDSEDSLIYIDGIFERCAYNDGKLFIYGFNRIYYVFDVDAYTCNIFEYDCNQYNEELFKEMYPDYKSYNWRHLRNIDVTKAEKIKNKVEKALNLDLSKGTVAINYDSHGGFLGDGVTLIAIKFEDDTELTEKLKNSKLWNKLPLPNEIRKPLESLSGNDMSFNCKNGYYFFYDRHSESKDPLDYSELNYRYSFNFIVGLYDTDEKYLYYFKGDT